MTMIMHYKNLQLTDGMKKTIETKISKIVNQYLTETEAIPVHINLSAFKKNHCIEVTIPLGDLTIRAEETTNDLYKSIDLVEDKLKRQLRKYKTKVNRIRKERFVQELELNDRSKDQENEEIVRIKHFQLKPMDVEEAILQMNLLDHNFFVFQDAETEQMSIVYKRKHEQYGLITSEVAQ
ncbi:ribosome-associated translation inhibitor RaiA [Pullulanibacillus sp. KACC 23026]|uniref:ribosome hibernation-promoting factor, HPF/YfiA family n=1 Tax=Pullulanibacillus sp. KACC 23026 TaxID=3028315 RepID=UPI0023B1329F|nr:ribosome-associated translation inhibitor RaiA [Pullulanibacillus sp. KACC 23026]WEG11030.1 ribosome-associated translation inhibitor RaiA [Pullulanibacillus sp. KACC 23026]